MDERDKIISNYLFEYTEKFKSAIKSHLHVYDDYESEELLAQAYERAWKSRAGFQLGTGSKGFCRWFYTIMKNVNIDNWKKKSAQRLEIEFNDAINGHKENIIEVLYIQSIMQNLDVHLPKNERICLTSFLEGYKYKEISKRECLPISEVKKRIFEARTKLKRLYRNSKPDMS